MSLDHQEKLQHFINQQLNEKQREAVTPRAGIFLVCAGAGSGKTRVITARIANLIMHEGVRASSLVALTFTNKAAKEMQERVRAFLSAELEVPYVGTFHSYCLRLLKINYNLFGLQDFTILDGDDQEKLIKGLIKKYAITKKINPYQVISAISQSKNNISHVRELDNITLGDPLLQQFFTSYEHEKKISHCLDFDDLLVQTLRLFQQFPEFKEKFQRTVKHILVDEYQDTNRLQHALLKEMTLTEDQQVNAESLCVVGDEDQSIYSWRGATVSNIINFKREYPTTTLITIDQNYRSVKPILDTANHVIQHNVDRNPKNLWSDKTAYNRVQLMTCASPYQEGAIIAQYGQLLKKHKKLMNLAVLYRSHYQSRTLEEALIRHSIPYKIIGGTQFYDRQEVKDIIAYLRLAHNPFDRLSFMRAIATPSRGLGDKFVELFLERWDPQPFLDFKGIAQQLIDELLIPASKRTSLKEFLALYASIEKLPTAYAIAQTILTKIDYKNHLKDAYEGEEATARIENINELMNGIKVVEERGVVSLSQFLDEVALLQEHTSKKNDSNDYVRLMTLHGAKGLEFDTVVITGLEENVLPSSHSSFQQDLLEEERRLLYVGITRAEERLILTSCKYRTTYGQMTDQRPSRFISELPSNLVAHYDCSQWTQEQTLYNLTVFSQQSTSLDTPLAPRTGSGSPREPWPTAQVLPKAPTYTPASSPMRTTTLWKKHQPVTHATFGTGIIELVEEKDSQTTYLTIRFKIGTKKISAQFVNQT